MLPECVECTRLGEDIPSDSILIYFGISFKRWISIVVMILIMFLIVWFICLDVFQNFEELTIKIREHFDSEAACLMSQFETNSNIMYDEKLSALQNMSMNEPSMLDDDDISSALCLRNSREKIAWFFLKVEYILENSFSKCSCKREDTGLLYFEKLYQMDQRKSEPKPRYLNKLRQIIQMKSNRVKINLASC